MKLKVYAFGKLKTAGLAETASYYQKLLRPWVSLEEVELKPIPLPNKSPSTRLQVQEKEGKLLLGRLQADCFFLLDETGQPKTTQQWAQDLRIFENTGVQTIAFCIGSSIGFSQEIRKQARGAIHLGPQTLSHELARVILYEQLYRAMSVIRGHPYHNEGM